jgi:hypothetical protein
MGDVNEEVVWQSLMQYLYMSVSDSQSLRPLSPGVRAAKPREQVSGQYVKSCVKLPSLVEPEMKLSHRIEGANATSLRVLSKLSTSMDSSSFILSPARLFRICYRSVSAEHFEPFPR